MPGFRIPYVPPPGCPSPLDSTGPSHTTETARKHRYLLEVLEPLGSQDDGVLLFLEKCTRPSPEFDKIMIHSAQDEISRPGKTHWKDVELTFYEKLEGDDDDQENQCARLIYEWWSDSMLDISTSLHKAPSDYLKNCTLQMLDGAGNSVWSYNMYDCWPMRITPSDLNYSDSNIATISITLAYARAIETGRSL